MAGSKPKGVAQQLFEAQQRRAAHKAALEKAARAAQEKEKRAAARREEAAARQAQRAAEESAKRQQASDARQVQQVLRELEKRETLRQQAEARQALVRERDAARDEKARAVQRLKDEAAERTREIEQRVAAIGGVLTGRDRGLEPLRADTGAALESGGADGFADCVSQILAERAFLRRAHPEVAYSPDARRLTVAVDLPRPEGVPSDRAFRYVAAQEAVVAIPRREAETQRVYRDAVARLALCVADYAAAITAPEAVEVIAVNGHVRATDPATGRPVRPCLVSLLVERDAFELVALDEPSLDPVRCLAHLRALLSDDPLGLQPVIPFVDPGLERRPSTEAGAATVLDLTAMDPYDFERLIRDLFLAMGFRAWKTPDSRDGGVDAVAVRDDIAIGGVCVIQAKRYTRTVPVEAVRALYGTMQEHKAYTGLVVTTSSFGPASHAFAAEVGRITLVDGARLRALIKEHLGVDAVVSGRRTATS
ncbi:restriction system protein [Catenulispora sp. MAP5-51]|uniref:restriction endonuclease n=1 Tax=Catenulispora sp. MAP5-51 TaxID=3156298 RepID=UPI003511FA48